MTNISHIRAAILAITKKIRNGEIAKISDEIINGAGGLEAYIERAYLNARSADIAKITKSMRDAGYHDATAHQLSFDGMPHASVPSVVIVRDPKTKEQTAILWRLATFSQWESELRRREKDLNALLSILEVRSRTWRYSKYDRR